MTAYQEPDEGPLEGRNLAVYMGLGALFIAALVVCNLVSNKFIEIDLGVKTFVISVGILPYPLTFLVTDLLSEFYGKRRTDYVVFSGFAALLLVLLVIWLGGLFPALPFLVAGALAASLRGRRADLCSRRRHLRGLAGTGG